MKTKLYRNGAFVTMEDRHHTNGLITVYLRAPDGELHDRIRVDDKKAANEYFKSFCKIARNLK